MSPSRILGKAALENGIDRYRQLAVETSRGWDRSGCVCGCLSRECLRQVGPATAEQLECDDRERVPIARCRRLAADRLLGRHVPRSTEDRTDARQRYIAGDPGDPEVGHAHLAVGSQHQVRGLDVTVDDTGCVRRVERPGRLSEPRECERRGDRPRPQPVCERASRQELHHDRGTPSRIGHVVDRDDIRLVRQPSSDPRLARKTHPDLGIVGKSVVQRLDCDQAFESVVGRDIDVSHAAGRDQLGPAVTRRERERSGGHKEIVPHPWPGKLGC